MQAPSPAFTLQSFNTFDMSVGYSPTGSKTTFATPKYVGDALFRESISPMDQMQLTYPEEEVVDLTGTEDDDSNGGGKLAYSQGETYEEAIDLTNDDDTEMVDNTTSSANRDKAWHGVAFTEEGLVLERTNGGVTNRICTPYYKRKPVVSILAPIKQRKERGGGDIKHPIAYERAAV